MEEGDYFSQLDSYIRIYRIACNFRGAKYSWFSWLEV